MDGKRLIEKIRLRNILSFGDKGEEITLEPLNIIIGQNASGKSNLVDVIKLLQSLQTDKGLPHFLSKNGGISEWIWKGIKRLDNTAEIKIELKIIPLWKNSQSENISYTIKFTEDDQKTIIPFEEIRDVNNQLLFFKNGDLPMQDSILSTYSKSSIDFFTKESEINRLRVSSFAHNLSELRFYTDLQTNRASELRNPKPPDVPFGHLEDDLNNLISVLRYLESKISPKLKIVENLKKFYPRIEDYVIQSLGDGEYLQLYLREAKLDNLVSSKRISDGTLRYLCLLAILCHPEPPPLICIEEPETGLHPDILPTIAELMIEASQRTQLIVTTHSDILVSAFSEIPEAVLVCEKDEDGTHFKRLDKNNLKAWLDEYELGDLWLKGEIGGKRW